MIFVINWFSVIEPNFIKIVLCWINALKFDQDGPPHLFGPGQVTVLPKKIISAWGLFEPGRITKFNYSVLNKFGLVEFKLAQRGQIGVYTTLM